MRKDLLFPCIFMAVLTACYKEEAVINEITQFPLTKSKDYLSGDRYTKMKRIHKITPERAILIAEEARNLFADENERMIRTFSVGTTLEPVAVTSGQQRSRAAGGIDTLMFVVNYGNDGGFVFVSNDDRDGEILMYAENGNFTMQDTTDNPVLKLHIEMMLDYQEHKLSEMRTAEARGEVYMGL